MRSPIAPITITCLALTFLAFAPSAQAQVFVERAEFGAGSTIPIAWADANDDGALDLAVGNYGGGNLLFINDGRGVFTGESQFGVGATFAIVWADFDEDGDPDLAVGIGLNTQNYLYINNADGTFTQQPQFGADRTIAVAWGDCDHDGDLDMALGNGILQLPEQNRLYRNNGDGSFTAEDQFGIGESVSVAWGDCDNDGDLDLAVGNGGFHAPGRNYLYVNNGDGSFTEEEQFGLGDTASVAWADADNDGDLDLAVGNWNDGQNYLYVNNGDGTFTPRAAFGARDTNTIAWGDYDNDGDLDLAVGNGDFVSADQNYLYVNAGDGTFTEAPAFGLGSTDSVAWADADGDGDLDLAAGNEHSPTQNYLYENRSAVGSWLAIELEGQHHLRGAGWSNRAAIGAKVSAYLAGHAGEPGSLLGHREVAAHGGFSSQNGRDAWFGLGSETAVDLIVRWPGSGGQSLTQTFASMDINLVLSLVEGEPLLHAPRPGTAGRVNLLRASGAPEGRRVHFVWGFSAGSTPIPGCGGVAVDLANPRIAGSAIANAAGEARLNVFVPAAASGRTVLLQAVVQEACATSNLIRHTFQ